MSLSHLSHKPLDFMNKIVFGFIDLSFKTNKERNGVIMRGNWQEKGNYAVFT